MTDPDESPAEPDDTGWMHRRYPYGPLGLRLIAPVIAIVVGVFLALRSMGGIGKSGDGNTTGIFVFSLVVIVVAVIAIPVARWMAKRGY
jgi:hypothetical protein